MDVIVVDSTWVRLMHDLPSTPDRLGAISPGDRPLGEKGLDDVAHEDPLDAGVRVLEQRLDEKPLALDVEAKPASFCLVAGDAVGPEMDESGAVDRRAIEGRHVKEQIRVDSGSVGEVRRQRSAARAVRQVPDAEGRAWPLTGNLGGGALDRLRESRKAPVTIVTAKPAEPAGDRAKLGPVGQDPAIRRPYGSPPRGDERGRGSHAAGEAGEASEASEASEGNGHCGHAASALHGCRARLGAPMARMRDSMVATALAVR